MNKPYYGEHIHTHTHTLISGRRNRNKMNKPYHGEHIHTHTHIHLSVVGGTGIR